MPGDRAYRDGTTQILRRVDLKSNPLRRTDPQSQATGQSSLPGQVGGKGQHGQSLHRPQADHPAARVADHSTAACRQMTREPEGCPTLPGT